MLALIALGALSTVPIRVTPPNFAQAREAQIAIDADLRVYVAYGMGDATYVSTSSDQGATYAVPVKVADAGKLSLGMRRGPRIAVHNGVVTVTATVAKLGGGRDGDLVAFRSADRGKTWSGPVRVNDVEGSGREGLHAMATGPDGALACVWLDLRTKGTKLYSSVSKDGGASWSVNRLVYASPGGSICECCHPSVAFGPDGKIVAMFRNSISGARDMYVASSSDGGLTYGPAAKLGRGVWMLDACPMDGGAVAVSPGGEIRTIWRRESTIYTCRPSLSEKQIAGGSQGWIATTSAGDSVVWSDGTRILGKQFSDPAFQLTANGNDAVVAASPDGSLVLAAWTEDGIQSAVLRR